MNVFCPSCQSSVPLAGNQPAVHCSACGLNIELSALGTQPGLSGPTLVRDYTGERIGPYELLELIGVGGMGTVYKARALEDVRPVAVKLINREYHWNKAEFAARFERETKALNRLNHPHIVRLLDSGQEGDVAYLVTEFVDGQNLAQYIKASALTPAETAKLLLPICDALSYAHGQGVVHRDIKPANIVVENGRPMVLDFGLAQLSGGETQLTTLTRTDLALGTFNYLSPEQRLNAKAVDARTDVYSLGVVFYEMLTGGLPLGHFEPPSRVRKDIPKSCDRMIEKSLAPSPEARYQRVADFSLALSRLAHPPKTKQRLLIGAASLMVGAALAVGVIAGLGLGIPPESKTIQKSALDEQYFRPIISDPPPAQIQLMAAPPSTEVQQASAEAEEPEAPAEIDQAANAAPAKTTEKTPKRRAKPRSSPQKKQVAQRKTAPRKKKKKEAMKELRVKQQALLQRKGKGAKAKGNDIPPLDDKNQAAK